MGNWWWYNQWDLQPTWCDDFWSFLKKRIKTRTISSFQQGKHDSPVDGIDFPISRHCWTQRRMVQYCFCLAQLRSERVALVLWGFCSLPKRGRPENDKKRQTFLGRQGSRSWNDPYLPGSLMSWASWASWVWSCRSLGAATKTGWRRPSPVFRDSSDSGPQGFSRLA